MILICIEGLTNSGKTTLCKKLADQIPLIYINDLLHADVVMSNIARITNPIDNLGKFDITTEMLLYLSMLSQKAHLIEHFNDSNRVLLVDRFSLSVFAQFCRDFDCNFIRELVRFSSNYIIPDYTIFLDTNLDVILERTITSPFSRKDLFLPYKYDSIRNAYIENISEFSKSYHIMDYSSKKGIEKSTNIILKMIEDLCSKADTQEKANSMVWISAGGKGTRLQELTTGCPKPLLKVGGNYLMEYLCKHLISTGFSNKISVSYCYLKEMWEPFIATYKNCISFFDSAGMPNLVADLLRYVNASLYDNYIIISGDVIFDFSIINDLLEKHCRDGNDVSLALNRSNDNQWKSWDYVMDNYGRILDVVKKEEITHIERYCLIVKRKIIEQYTSNFSVNMGLCSGEFVNYQKYNSGWTYLVKRILDYGGVIRGYFYCTPVINVNTQDDLMRAKKYLSTHYNELS